MLSGVRGIGIVRLDPLDVIRHDVVSRIVEAYDSYEAKKKERREKLAAGRQEN